MKKIITENGKEIIMTREKYESLSLATLKELAKARKMKGVSTLKKSDLIDAMLALDEKEEQQEAATEAKEEVREELKEKEGRDRYRTAGQREYC